MNLEKRKCHKGSQHTGRSIQALCLEPNCTHDRLLCFYCIHESHHNHSIAYLISGLKSPLELLNKNSHSQNPQQNMKYIENRFKRINKGWLKISDNLQGGIAQIEERMTPQFNVIRQTFKKNSVDHIIQELTSNEITSERIQEYVGMINMVKKYKFNNVNKLKFMAFMIEHKLSKIFLNANKKINQIMNRVIEETNELNFLNFNFDQLLKDRSLYLEVSRNLTICKITGLEINSLNYEVLCGQKNSQMVEVYDIQSNQIGEGDQINEIVNGQNQEASLVVMEGAPNQEKLNQDLLQQKQRHLSGHQMMEQGKELMPVSGEDNPQNLNDQVEESAAESYSNGFRSYQKALEEKKMMNSQLNIGKQCSQMIKSKSQEGEIWSDQEEKVQQQENEEKEANQGFDVLDLQQPKSHQSNQVSPQFDEENLDFEKQFKEAHGVQAHSQSDLSQQEANPQSFQGNYEKRAIIGQQNNGQIEEKILEEKEELDGLKIQKDLGQYIANDQNNHQGVSHEEKALSEFSCQFPSIKGNEDQDLMNMSDFQSNDYQIGCENETQEENFMPSYHFSLSINSAQMTLTNTFNLKCNPTISQNSQIQQPIFVQTFNENNLFDQFFQGNHGEQPNPNQRPKNLDLLKKYFVFYNGQNSDESSQQLGAVPPKRAKWVEDHKKQLRKKSDQKLPKKKLKLPEQMQQLVNDIEFMDYPRTRTRSERIKLAKILEKPNSPNHQPKDNTSSKKGPKKGYKKSGPKISQENDSINEQEQHDKDNPMSNDISNDSIIRQVQQEEEQSESRSKSKLNDKNYIKKQQNSNKNSQADDHKNSESENDEKGRNEEVKKDQKQKNQQHPKSNINTKQAPSQARFSNLSSQNLPETKAIHYPHNKLTYPHSFTLDRNSLAEVSHSLLHKYEQDFMKDEKYKRQTDEEEGDKKIKIKKVYLNGRFHQEIKKRLSLIDQSYIEELTIYCDTMECAINEESAALICKMTRLTKLCVYWTYRLPKILTKKLISSLPLLQELVLCELQDLDTDIANQIVSKLPNLKRFHCASDYMKNLDKMEENLEFLIDFVGTSTKLAPLFILSKLKNLETFWASDIDDIKQVKQILAKMKILKEVSISAFQKRNKDLNLIFNILSKRDTLISLSLQGLQFKEDSLVSIIRNNPNLNTLVINECPTVSNNTLAAVAETCHELEQLFLMLTDSLEGERIFQLKKLRTLVVRACWSINVAKFRDGIKKLKNLRYLSLNMNNYWLNDEMLPSIATLPNLVFLNLDTTKVTDKGMQYLVGLKNLNTLICGRTQITSTGLYKFLEKSKSHIRKLGLSRESNQELNRPQKRNKHDVNYTEFEGKYLVRIGELLPELTHLSIGGFKHLHIQDFATLDNLKCLQYKMQSLLQQTEKFLQTTRLNLNANF